MPTYFVRQGGVATKAQATGPSTDLNKCMSPRYFKTQTFGSGDIVHFHYIPPSTPAPLPGTIVSLKSNLRYPVTIHYNGDIIVIPPKGIAEGLDNNLISGTIPNGVNII